MTAKPFIPPVPNAPYQWDQQWGGRIQAVLNMLVGKANCVFDLTLTAGATSTDMTDARLGAQSVLCFMPTTSHAATAHGTIYVTDQKKGYAKINHANTADTDKTFRVSIHG